MKLKIGDFARIANGFPYRLMPECAAGILYNQMKNLLPG